MARTYHGSPDPGGALEESIDHAAVFNAALDAMDRGDDEGARERLERVVCADRNDTEAQLLLAELERDAGQVLEARERLEGVLDRLPTWEAGLVALASLLLSLGDETAAAGCCRQVLEKNANNWEALYLLGNAFSDAQAWPEAQRAYQATIELHPFFGDAWFNLGRAGEESGDHQQAITCYGTYLKMEPEAPDALEILKHMERLKMEPG